MPFFACVMPENQASEAGLKSSSRTWSPSFRLPEISRFAVEGFGGSGGKCVWIEPVPIA
jgi:hypothetical protein